MRVLALLAAIAAVVAVLTATAGAQGRLTSIELVSKQLSLRTNDLPPEGLSRGDSGRQTSRLHNAVRQWGKPAGAVVGRDRATYTLNEQGQTIIEGVTFLPGGTLVLRGQMRPHRGGIVAPVVRGTGRYAGARGTLRITRAANPPRTLNTYTLRYVRP